MCRGGRPVHRQKAQTLGPSQTRPRRHATGRSEPGHTPILRSGERDHHELAVLRRRPPYRDRSRGPGSNLRRRRRHLGRLRRVQRASPRVLSRPVPSLFLVVEPREPRSHPRSPLPRPSQVSPEEVQKIVAGFEDPSGLQAGGIYSAARSTCSSARTIASWRARRCVVSFSSAPRDPSTHEPPTVPPSNRRIATGSLRGRRTRAW